MKSTRLATKIIKTLIKDRIHYPSKLIADTFTMIARCGILLTLYAYVFKLEGGQINGTGFAVVAWSIFFYFCFSMLRLRDIPRMIMLDVQTGNIEVLLNKPISYLLYRSWWQIGAGTYSFLVSLILGVALLWIIIGIPATMTTVLFWSTLLAVIFGTLLLGIILYLIVGILAFWIEDINPVFWVVDKAVMILGGSYLPLALFPAFMQKVALYSPFGAVQFITHTVYVSWSSQWWIALAMQAFWIITLGIVLHVLFIAAREKVSVNGG